MLSFGDHTVLPDASTCIVWNLSSLLEGFQRIYLLPPMGVVKADEKAFDIQYAEWILQNDAVFFEFFSKIMIQLYSGLNVFILIKKTEFIYDVSDSLIKFIQQRYGYNSNIINTAEDWEYAEDSNFNVFGIKNLDADKQRYFDYGVSVLRWEIDENGRLKQRGYDIQQI